MLSIIGYVPSKGRYEAVAIARPSTDTWNFDITIERPNQIKEAISGRLGHV
jgi:hypothetical protein